MEKAYLTKKKPNYPTLGEFKSKKFMNIATAVGIGVSATVISLDLNAEEKKVVEKKEPVKDKAKVIKDKIILLAVNLGHKDFKEREQATISLIKLGQECIKKKDSKMTEFIKTEVKKQSKSKDPEVKERSKKILLALNPIPPAPPNHRRGDIQIGGLMIAPQR